MLAGKTLCDLLRGLRRTLLHNLASAQGNPVAVLVLQDVTGETISRVATDELSRRDNRCCDTGLLAQESKHCFQSF